MRFLYLVLFFVCIAPASVFADVRINEVAWMGTLVSSNDEWIELYNTGSNEIDLSGWVLTAADGSPDILLDGSISSGGYFLLERTDDLSAAGVTADMIYSGALSNSGELLSLKNAQGSVANVVNHAEGWQGGDNILKETMQFDGSGWITASSTPGAANIASGNSEEGSSGGTVGENNEESESSNVLYDEDGDIVNRFTLSLEIDPVVVAGVPMDFDVRVFKDGVRQYKGIHSWSFGDGGFVQNQHRYSRDNIVKKYTYENPGTYVAVFQYRTSIVKRDPDIEHRVYVHVTDHAVHIKDIIPWKSITLENNTTHEIDLAGWSLSRLGEQYIFPPNTIMLPKSTLTVSQKLLGVPVRGDLVLQLPGGETIDTVEPLKVYTPTKKVSKEDVTDIIQPISNAATVVFSEDNISTDSKQRGGGAWFFIALIVVILTGSILVAVVVLYIYTKTPTSDDVGVDEITILED